MFNITTVVFDAPSPSFILQTLRDGTHQFQSVTGKKRSRLWGVFKGFCISNISVKTHGTLTYFIILRVLEAVIVSYRTVELSG
jgi:hypothetical protein